MAEKKKIIRLPDDEKIKLLNDIMEAIDKAMPDLGIDMKNPERELVFEFNNSDYSLMLVKHRPPKEEGDEDDE